MQTSCLGKLSQELLIRIARKVEEELQRPLQVGFFSSSFQFIEVVDQQMHVSKPYNQVGGFAPEETGVRVEFFLQLSSISTPNTLGQVFRSRRRQKTYFNFRDNIEIRSRRRGGTFPGEYSTKQNF